MHGTINIKYINDTLAGGYNQRLLELLYNIEFTTLIFDPISSYLTYIKSQ